MLKLLFFAFLVYLVWNVGRVVYFIVKTGKRLNEQNERLHRGGQRPGGGNSGEKDITDRTRIINED